MKNKLILLTSLIFSAVHSYAADNLLDKTEQYRLVPKPYKSMVKVVNYESNKSVANQSTYKVFIKDNDTSLVEQTAPASEAGNKLLMIGFNIWLKTIDTKKSIRVNFQAKLSGAVANGDISKTNFKADYKIESQKAVDQTLELDLRAKTEGATYSRIRYFVNSKNYQPIKAEFMTEEGKVLKTAYYSGLKKTKLGKSLITEIKIIDAVTKKYSTLVYDQFEFFKADESLFNRASM